MKRIQTYQKFAQSRPIKEEFIGKMWRNLTGKNKERVEKVNTYLSKFNDLKSTPKIEDIPYLHLDKEAKAFYLIQEVKSFYKYLPFKHLMQDFSSQVLEWKQIFEDFS